MELGELKALCDKSPWVALTKRIPKWGDAEEILDLRTLPQDEKFFISCCWESLTNVAVEDTGITDGIPAELRGKANWVSASDMGTVVARNGGIFYCLLAWDEDGDFIVTTSPFPWAFLRKDPIMASMKDVVRFSVSPIEFFRKRSRHFLP